MVRSGCSPPPMVDATPARPASQVWNASVDVLRRTRRNADMPRIRSEALHRILTRTPTAHRSSSLKKPRGQYRPRQWPCNPRLTAANDSNCTA